VQRYMILIGPPIDNALSCVGSAYVDRGSALCQDRSARALNLDYLTGPFTYMRLLGDRKGIEKQTKIWGKVIVKRTGELRNWVDVCEKTTKRGANTFVYINNHFSGHAPATVQEFLKLWNAK
jgi:uncharacterized protein YecE (DUF72 family)